MNIKQAKAIPITELLLRLGHSPTSQASNENWYRSPFRDERTPSFKVSEQNKWYDFATGDHGDGIDLVGKLLRCNSVKETLLEIASLVGAPLPEAASPTPIQRVSSSKADIVDIRALSSHSLRDYLKRRGLDDAVAREHLKEVRYRRGGKEFFAIGFENDVGDYEIRTQRFKGSLGRKSISTIARDSNRVSVFEGFTDYLTAICRQELPAGDTVIVMNSAAMKDPTMAKITELKPNRVSLWLDNDETGRKLTDELMAQLQPIEVIDEAFRYAGSSDFNAFHVANLSKQKSP